MKGRLCGRPFSFGIMLILDYLCTIIITIIPGVYLVLVLFSPYALITNPPSGNPLQQSPQSLR